MERIRTLREQASVLRALAGSFDIQPIRNQLLDLAARCEELAQSMENLEAVPKLARKQLVN